jgi:hypothetical protein
MVDDSDCGAIGRMKIGRGNRTTRRKPTPVPLCSPQIPHDLTRARTRATAVGSQRLTAWAMAWPTLPHYVLISKTDSIIITTEVIAVHGVRRRLLVAEARVWYRATTLKICRGPNTTGSFRFFCSYLGCSQPVNTPTHVRYPWPGSSYRVHEQLAASSSLTGTLLVTEHRRISRISIWIGTIR